MKTALVLYPHQLYPVEHLPQVDAVVMVEEPLFFGVDQQYPSRLHKQKLILHRASMRRYAEEVLWPKKIDVDYVELDVFMQTGDVLGRLRKFDRVYVFDPIDETIATRLLQARREQENGPSLEFLPSPSFYLQDHELRQFLAQNHSFAEFYQWQRERFNILIGEDYKPLGGTLMFETEPKALPAKAQLASFSAYGNNTWVEEAVRYVDEHFPNNPGNGGDCIWPTNRQEALAWLADFTEKRLDTFAEMHGAFDGEAAWLSHSALSSSLLLGLLLPGEVVDAALQRHAKRPVELASLELFVRQILGWRELVRGLYVTQGSGMKTANPLKFNRKLTSAWYNGTTGIPPFDDLARKLQQHAYAHQTERLVVAGGLMVLCEIDPADMQRWFAEQFIDAIDWSVTPNVYGLTQFGEHNTYFLRPSVMSSTHLMQISRYERGVWADVWDGLFWRFVEKHKAVLQKDPGMRTTVQRLHRLDADRRRIISYRAEDFLAKFTA